MSEKLRLILAGVLVFVGLFGQQIFSFVKENVEIVNIPSVEKEEPNLTYKTLVQDITDLDIEPQDARQLGDFFSELADVVKTDPGFIKTTGVFRDFNVRAGGLNFAGLEIKNKYPSLGQEIDGAIMDTLGDQDVSLTDEKKERNWLIV